MLSESNINSGELLAPGLFVNALQAAPVPALILQGEELRITFANNALLNFWSKDKSIVNKLLLDVLPEIKDQPFPDLLRTVLRTGKTINEEEAVAYVQKNGESVKIYCDYSYTAITDQLGNHTAVLVIAKDVTKQVESRLLAEQRQAMLAAIVNSS